jgi:UDP-N-acetylmuramoylalanine--D-glutamate ligase
MKNIANKHITILGAVRSGVAAAKLAKKLGAIPFVSDFSSKLSEIAELDNLGINYELGGHSEKVFDCDFIITSPGVPSNSAVIVEAINKGIKIISEIEFASWFCKGNIIAITGSNGKTTTTELCNHTLNFCGIKSYSAGNIGLAFSEIALDVKTDEFVVLEVSSFQLDFIDEFKPKYSIILNITPDHLDRYENNFNKYAESKMKIQQNQNNDDYFIFNIDDNYLANSDVKNVNKIHFSLKAIQNGFFVEAGKFKYSNNGTVKNICDTSILQIKGEHNQYNAMAVIALAELIGISNEKLENALSSFKGVEHRLELVRIINGISFINDSKATNVDSVWYALRSFETPIHLILGGKDKGNDYSQIKDLVAKNVKKIYAIGSSANKIYDYFNLTIEVQIMDTFEDAVTIAFNSANSGEIVLLSPACASFDMFNNYEHRGDSFKQIVMNL